MPDFQPRLYLKQGCPFCFKVRVFLLEAGLAEHVEVRSFIPGTAQEDEIRSALDQRLSKVSFPAAELTPGHFVADTDIIIADIASRWHVDPTAMPVLGHYIEGPLQQIASLWKQNQELRAFVK